MAQECLREGLPEPSEPPQPLEGLEMFAQTIETGELAPLLVCSWALLSTGQEDNGMGLPSYPDWQECPTQL